jgi:hypothetical protein
MNIALVIDHFHPGKGGAEGSLEEILSALHARGHSLHLVAMNWEPSLETWLKTHRVAVARFPRCRRDSSFARRSSALLKELAPGLVLGVRHTLDADVFLARNGLYCESLKATLRAKPSIFRRISPHLFPKHRVLLNLERQLFMRPEAPKTLRDLLNPKWKGKMSLVTSSSGTRWIGNALDAMGREFVEKLAEQDMRLQDMSGAALSGLVVTGEVPLSPTIFDANVSVHKQKGAPIEWRPLEPVVTNVGYSSLSIKSPNPHGAMLLLDYIHSKEGQQVIMKGGLWSPRDDIGTVEQRFKKSYLDEKYSIEELETKYGQWEQLIRRLFGQRR